MASATEGLDFSFILIFLIEVQLMYNAVPISAVQQSDSVIHIQTFFWIFNSKCFKIKESRVASGC